MEDRSIDLDDCFFQQTNFGSKIQRDTWWGTPKIKGKAKLKITTLMISKNYDKIIEQDISQKEIIFKKKIFGPSIKSKSIKSCGYDGIQISNYICRSRCILSLEWWNN